MFIERERLFEFAVSRAFLVEFKGAATNVYHVECVVCGDEVEEGKGFELLINVPTSQFMKSRYVCEGCKELIKGLQGKWEKEGFRRVKGNLRMEKGEGECL